MFDSLSTRFQDVFKTLRGETRLTPENIETALREIRLALLEADVNFKVVKAFIDRVRDRAIDAAKDSDVLRGASPSQQVVRIVRDEMVALFGTTDGGLQPSSKRPRVVLLLGAGARERDRVGRDRRRGRRRRRGGERDEQNEHGASHGPCSTCCIRTDR